MGQVLHRKRRGEGIPAGRAPPWAFQAARDEHAAHLPRCGRVLFPVPAAGKLKTPRDPRRSRNPTIDRTHLIAEDRLAVKREFLTQENSLFSHGLKELAGTAQPFLISAGVRTMKIFLVPLQNPVLRQPQAPWHSPSGAGLPDKCETLGVADYNDQGVSGRSRPARCTPTSMRTYGISAARSRDNKKR